MPLLYTLFVFNAVAQNIENDKIDPPCAADMILERMIQEDPGYALQLEREESRIRSLIQSQSTPSRSQIYTLPMVIHILHEGEDIGNGSNISDEQILSAVVALNEDFRKVAGSNGDGDGVDVEMEFCLASRDPDGNPTSGIIRKDASIIPEYAELGIEASGGVGADEDDVKALSNWPHEDYINVWIVNEIEDNDAGSGIQGYAYFPWNNPKDGIVVLHNAFGTVGNVKSNRNMNRTFTHEMGHYLKLYHTFHLTNDCGPESNCMTQGDQVCDTPPDPGGGSCTSPLCDGTQPVENYMSYNSQICQDMFTQGQKERMTAALLDPQSYRYTLLESLACAPVSENDIGVETILNMNFTNCADTIAPVVVLRNYGSNDISGVELTYLIDGNTIGVENFDGTISSGSSAEIPLVIDVTLGQHTFEISTSLNNGLTDDYQANDVLTYDFEFLDLQPVSVNLSLDYLGQETHWALTSDDGTVQEIGGPYLLGSQGVLVNNNVCLTDGCYNFTIYDEGGDGLTFISGDYQVVGPDGSLIASYPGGEFSQLTTPFCIGSDGDFSSNIQEVCLNGLVDFFDESEGEIISWNWFFEGAVNSTSSDQNPSGIQYISAGTYDVSLTVSDGENQTTVTKSDYITVGSNMEIISDVSHPLCFGDENGSIDITLPDPQGSYEFLWSTDADNEDVSGLGNGIFSVTITDDEGCISDFSFELIEPTEIIISATSVPDLNNQGVGEIQAEIEGGTEPYTYELLDSGFITSDLLNIGDLLSGTYELIVTDANGCQAFETIVVENQNAPVANFIAVDESCAEELVNFTNLSINNPTNLTWVFEGGLPATSSASNPEVRYDQPGTYSVLLTVSNLNGIDTKVGSIVIHELPTVEIETINAACVDSDNGSVSIHVDGGQMPYSYFWNTGAEVSELTNLEAGEYSVIVSDLNGCADTLQVEIASEICVGIDENQFSADEFFAFPNPFDGKSLFFNYPSKSDLNVFLHDVSGRSIPFEISKKGNNLYTLRITNKVTNGLYFITVINGDEKVTEKISVE